MKNLGGPSVSLLFNPSLYMYFSVIAILDPFFLPLAEFYLLYKVSKFSELQQVFNTFIANLYHYIPVSSHVLHLPFIYHYIIANIYHYIYHLLPFKYIYIYLLHYNIPMDPRGWILPRLHFASKAASWPCWAWGILAARSLGDGDDGMMGWWDDGMNI